MESSIKAEKSAELIEPDSSRSIPSLNDRFIKLTPIERLHELYKIYDISEVLFTSSFGANSAYLLFLLSQVNPQQEVHFINTGYLFDQTISYKDKLAEKFGLKVIELNPRKHEHLLTKEENWWVDHPKMCCAINKIAPLDFAKRDKKVWVSGVLGFQTEFRSNLGIFAPQGDLLKFHPLIDIEEGNFLYETSINKLPKHPLAEIGYGSIGCTHCTEQGAGRSGRWAGSEKTECGLHTHFFKNKKELDESK